MGGGCKSCSLLADTFDGASVHLPARDISFVAISRAPFAKLAAFKKRMGWNFRWLSSAETDFNFDFRVSSTPEQRAAGTFEYNYGNRISPATSSPARASSCAWATTCSTRSRRTGAGSTS